MPNDPSWGTVQEAAERSGLHHRTIRRYINDGLIPARRIGVKLIRVDLNAVDDLMSQPYVPAEVSK